MPTLEDQVDELKAEVARLSQLVEHLLARPVEGAATPTRIATVKLSGTTGRLQDFDGSSWADAPAPSGGTTADVEITVHPASYELALWREVARRWELLSTTVRIIEFTLPSAITAEDASIADCPVVYVWYGSDPGDTVAVVNDYGWEADAGAQGIAIYRPTTSQWVIVLLPCATGSS